MMIDLHVHSFISDGTYSPKEIINLAGKNNIEAIALTDHDAIEGNEEAGNEAAKLNIHFLSGIEISALYKDDRILHILGLNIDTKNKNFLNAYNEIKEAREIGVADILKILDTKNIHIEIESLRKNSTKKYLDRYDIHRYFIREGLCMNAQEIWDKYLDPVPYGHDELMTAEEAIDLIKEAGGLSFIAHYNKKIGFAGYTKEEIDDNIKYLVNRGLDGVERYYPSFNRQDHEFLDYLIKKYNLICSGGTDFHGENRPDIDIGTGHHNLCIPFKVYVKVASRFK